MSKSLFAAALGAFVLLADAGTSHAQIRGFSPSMNGYGAGFSGQSFNRGGGYYGGRGGYYGGGYYGGGYGGGYYPGSSYGYSPYYSGNNYAQPYYGQPADVANYYAPPAGNPVNAGAPASVEIRVPADAQVWVDGSPTTQRGETRTFATPAMPAGRSFTYEIRARWMQDGKPVEQTRNVQLASGARETVDFRNSK